MSFHARAHHSREDPTDRRLTSSTPTSSRAAWRSRSTANRTPSSSRSMKPGKGGAFGGAPRCATSRRATSSTRPSALEGEKFTRIDTRSQTLQFLYSTESEVVLMDPESYEQVWCQHGRGGRGHEVGRREHGRAGLLPSTAPRRRAADHRRAHRHAHRARAGARRIPAQGGSKPATLETGSRSRSRLFIEQGERIKVDTRRVSTPAAPGGRTVGARRRDESETRRHHRDQPQDGQQSLWATRMRTSDMLPILELMDEVGYHSLECWGGATFDAAMRRRGPVGTPARRQAARRAHTAADAAARPEPRRLPPPRRRHRAPFRLQGGGERRRHLPRVFDALNDVRNFETPPRPSKRRQAPPGRCGVHDSPVHSPDHYLEVAHKQVLN